MKLFLFVLILGGLLHAQITINSSHVPSTPGTVYHRYNVSDSVSLEGNIPVNVGNSGPNESWSFSVSEFSGGINITTEVKSVASTPFASEFPNADFAWSTEFGEGNILHEFYILTSAEFASVGYAAETNSGNYVSTLEVPERALQFPTQYQDEWRASSKDSVDYGDGLYIVTERNVRNRIDAWGTITVPAGTYDCLRLKESEEVNTRTYFDGVLVLNEVENSVSYIWLGQEDFLLAIIELSGTVSDEGPTTAYSVDLLVNSTVLNTDAGENIASKFQLHQNYPNPFNPTTLIQYDLAESSQITLQVYNSAGQLVKTLVDGYKSQGSHQILFDSNGLPSGLYYYQLQSGGQNITKKMILMK
ncbi:MAG: hypothetical protein Kow00108_10120 [Calditrichia bacterium]